MDSYGTKETSGISGSIASSATDIRLSQVGNPGLFPRFQRPCVEVLGCELVARLTPVLHRMEYTVSFLGLLLLETFRLLWELWLIGYLLYLFVGLVTGFRFRALA